MAQKRDSFGNVIPSFTSDAFTRARVSLPVTVFDDKHLYGRNNFNEDGQHSWLYIESGGTATYNGSDCTVDLATDLTSGSIVIKQSKRYIPYEPGKSQLIQMTGVPFNNDQATTMRIGQFDDNNGVYFGVFSGGQFGVGIRSDAGGTVVNSIAYQSDWNTDRLDGACDKTNPSKITLQGSAGLIGVIDYQWLALGTVRYGFMINGDLQVIHEAHHANITDKPYMRTSTLPLRYDIENEATVTTSAFLKSVCSTLISEGDQFIRGAEFSGSNAGTLRTLGDANEKPIMAIKLADSFLTRDNRYSVILRNFQGYSDAQSVYFRIAQLTSSNSVNGTFTAVESNVSCVEINTTVTSAAGADQHDVLERYVGADKSGGTETGESVSVRDRNKFLAQNYDSSDSECFVVFATKLTGASTDVGATISWEELQ